MENRISSPLVKRVSAAVVLCGLAVGSSAHAAAVLSFGQTSGGATVTATNNSANTQTLIGGSNVAVTLSQYAGGGAPISAFLNLSLTSTSAAMVVAGQILEPFSGSASFTSGIGGTGTNYLSASFTDFVFGTDGGSSLTLSATEPPGTVSFTSSVLPASELSDPRALSFGFADVTGPASIVGSTLRGFTSTVAGTVSAATTPVPEPATFALVGVGLLAMGAVQYRRNSKI